MANFSAISGQEPSTVSFKAATLTQTRNSSVMHQELITLADGESSLGVARVLAAAPASTEYGLVVRPVGYSTTAQVSSVGGVVSVAQNSTVWQVQVGGYSTTAQVSSVGGVVNVQQNSTVWQVQVGGYSTIAAVSSVGGVVNVQQNSTVWQVQVGGYSTIAAVSSVGGIVAVRPSDTNWASSAGFHFNSSGALQVEASVSVSTTVNVSSLAGIVAVRPSDTSWASSAGFHFNSSGDLKVEAVSVSGSTQMTLSQVLDSSGGGVVVGDSANNALRVNVVAGAAASTTVQVSSVGGVVNVQQNSTVWAVQVGGYSTIVSVAAFGAGLLSSAVLAGNSSALSVRVAWSSTNTDQPVSARVFQSTAADLQATVTQASTTWAVQQTNYSTTMQVSSLAGAVIVRSSAANFLATVYQSTIADLKATVAQNSTVWVVQATNMDGSGNALESGTASPSSAARGLFVRPVLGGITTYAASTTGNSSATTIVSSAAASKAFVFAYSITSTLAGPVQWGIYSGSTLLWTGILAAVSSAISGANLAVSPPAYLFAGSTGQPLTFNCLTSNAGLSVSLAYWQST